jgi:hypothetical protein
MHCPLCKAEFRQDFSTCSDCNVELVPTWAEASAASVSLWKGDTQKELDRILGALDGEQIPTHFREIVNYNWRIQILGIPIGRVVPLLNTRFGFFAGILSERGWLRALANPLA